MSSSLDDRPATDDDDFYHVLGVARDASEKQINLAFKKLALKYHPDRNVDDEYAAVKYKAVNEAFQILMDPVKRRLYDHRNENPPSASAVITDVSLAPSETTTAEGTSLTGIGRVFGAVISRLGIPINTQISPDIMATAQSICRNGGIEGGGPPLDPRVSDLPWGWAAEAKVDRQTAVYYRLTADPQHTDLGFIVHGRSASKGKFKMIIFDKDGTVLHQIDSFKDRDASYTQATFFFTTFDTYHLPDSHLHHNISEKDKEKSFPSVFSRLEMFSHSKKKIVSGQYLLCIYGDNLFGKTSFSIIAVPSKMDAPEVRGLEEVDEYLLQSKKSLEQLKNEYIMAKTAYEKVLEKISTTEDKVDSEVIRREKLYTGFIDASIREFLPISVDFETVQQESIPPISANIAIPASQFGSTNSGGVLHSSSPPSAMSAVSLLGAVGKSVSGGVGNTSKSIATSGGDDLHQDNHGNSSAGVLGYLTTNTINVASNAASVTTNAAQTATAAGGWIARRFSCKLDNFRLCTLHSLCGSFCNVCIQWVFSP
jgi:curved DNA-binding protein CbpA